jgi:hypothetical protein
MGDVNPEAIRRLQRHPGGLHTTASECKRAVQCLEHLGIMPHLHPVQRVRLNYLRLAEEAARLDQIPGTTPCELFYKGGCKNKHADLFDLRDEMELR